MSEQAKCAAGEACRTDVKYLAFMLLSELYELFEDWYETEYTGPPENFPSLSTLSRAWALPEWKAKLHMADPVSNKPCGICEKFRYMRYSATTAAERKDISKQWSLHYKGQALDRHVYKVTRESSKAYFRKALQYGVSSHGISSHGISSGNSTSSAAPQGLPSSSHPLTGRPLSVWKTMTVGKPSPGEATMSMIRDGADQARYKCPRDAASQKHFDTMWRPTLHVSGVIVHGLLEMYFVGDEDLKKDGNASVQELSEALLKARSIMKEKGLPLPLHLCIQMDNTARENKNYCVIQWACSLVASGVFQSVSLHFLITGHSHEDIDRRFKVFYLSS